MTAEWTVAVSMLTSLGIVLSALLVYRRAGQTVMVAEADSHAKAFEAISTGQERLRVALLARLTELDVDTATQREQIAALTARVVDLQQQNAECLAKTWNQGVRITELERVAAGQKE